ncbi:MAG: hypothetical protein IKM08_09975 [Clostridia bacterium]|nr:hypothetical protein [Clostridia bacterium]
MKLTKRMKEALGLSMLISAATLVVTFVVLSCKKRSILAALATMAAAEGACGALLLAERRIKRVQSEPCEDELFTEEECREANIRMRGVLGSRHNEDAAPRVLREIPRDEEATEADFQ